MNGDKRVNHFDIDPFLAALVDAEFCQQNYGWCRRDLADVNRDGALDVFDVDAFVDAVVSSLEQEGAPSVGRDGVKLRRTRGAQDSFVATE